jgi:hypothetical protein
MQVVDIVAGGDGEVEESGKGFEGVEGDVLAFFEQSTEFEIAGS